MMWVGRDFRDHLFPPPAMSSSMLLQGDFCLHMQDEQVAGKKVSEHDPNTV